MHRTIALYYDEPRLETCEARILSVAGKPEAPLLEFDRSLFYPEGGGQPCDLGSVNGIALLAVLEDKGRLFHRLAEPLALGPGDPVVLRLEAARRRDHTEQHSAQHLISGVFMRLLGAQTMSFHLGADRSTIDLALPELTEEDADAVEREINMIVAEDYPYVIHLCPPERLEDLPLRKRPPQGEEVIRVVEIDGLDFSPCCGTHVRSAGELRLVKLLTAEKYKGMIRLSFVAGGRAVEDYRRTHRSSRDAARILSAPQQELGPEAARVMERLKAAQADIAGLRRELAARNAELGVLRSGPGVVLLTLESGGADEAQETARALAERATPGLVLSVAELTACAALPAGPVSATPLGKALRPLAEQNGGRGGGGPVSFRAVFPDKTSLEAFGRSARDFLAGLWG